MSKKIALTPSPADCGTNSHERNGIKPQITRMDTDVGWGAEWQVCRLRRIKELQPGRGATTGETGANDAGYSNLHLFA